jgi:threonine aldolase
MIDYRSDTVTRPSKEMLQAMVLAPLGDDVFGEDPTVIELETKLASMFGIEDGIFCPSGTMTNQIAIKCHTQPGDEVICDQSSHVYLYEGGGIAFNAGCSVRLLNGDKGRLTADLIKEGINNKEDIHKPLSTLVSLENTANRGGGSCYNLEELVEIRRVCEENHLKLHLDGARLFNAIVAKKEEPEEYGKIFDSISICLSKGLGTPVGSVLLGTKQLISKARRYRKVLGGGMRQAGILAAAGIYALDNNIEKLAKDHCHAHQIFEVLKEKDFVGEILPAETNILIFEVIKKFSPSSFANVMKEKGILLIPISSTQVRMVLHLDITSSMVEQTIEVIQSL